MEKEFLYVGTYTDTDGNRILKIGTTNDLNRRRYEHNTNYRRAKTHTQCQKKKVLNTFGHTSYQNITLCGMRIEIAKRGKKWESVSLCGMTVL